MRAFWKKVALLSAFYLIGVGDSLAQQFVMKISSPVQNEVSHEWMKAFKAGVEERSGGRIKVELYVANQLGQMPATVEGVTMGTIEMAIASAGFLVGLEPRFIVLDTPGLFENMQHAGKVLADSDVRRRLSTFGQSKGVEPLITYVAGPAAMLSHKPVRKVADFQGQKIRVPGGAPMYVEPFKKLGALPLALPSGEMQPAMQNRSLDGVIGGTSLFTAAKYYDIAKGLTYLPGTFLVATGIVNRRFMNSLGPELEKIVREEAKKHEILFSTWGVEDAKKIRERWAQNGGENIELSSSEAALYLDRVTSVVPEIIATNSSVKADYDAILGVSRANR